MIEEWIIDWEHVYLLGWYDKSGKAYLTTWDDDGSMQSVNVVVTSVGTSVPMWDASSKGAIIHEIPFDKTPQEYAEEIGGYHAFGWYIEDGITRMGLPRD